MVYGYPRPAALLCKEKPICKFNVTLNITASRNDFKGVNVKRRFQFGNELCLAKPEYRTRKKDLLRTPYIMYIVNVTSRTEHWQTQ
jgi:hypothetical protein